MKFFGTGVVWDGELNKPLSKFVNGEYETEDLRIVGIMIKLGYRHKADKKPIADKKPVKKKQPTRAVKK